MRKAWLIIVPLVIWVLYVWNSDDEPPPGKALSHSAPPSQAVSPRDYRLRTTEPVYGGAGRRTTGWQDREPPGTPSDSTLGGVAGLPRGTFRPSAPPGPDTPRIGNYRFRPLTQKNDREQSYTAPPFTGQAYGQPPAAYGPGPVPQPYGYDYGAAPWGGGQPKFRPENRSQRASGRWTGNYPPLHQGYTPDGYRQWSVPPAYGGAVPEPWSAPGGNPFLPSPDMREKGIYSAR